MNEFSWEKLQQLVNKEKFTLTEAINALIDNQEELDLSENDLAHIIAILFQFEVDSRNCLLFTTFTGILRPKDLAEARQIIKEYKHPVTVTNNKYGFYIFDEYVESWDLESGGKELNKAFEVGVDKAKEGADISAAIIKLTIDLKPYMDELAEERRNLKKKPPLFLRNPKDLS